MNHKIITPILFGVLFLSFALVSLLVVLSRRHPYFVQKKLRIGALLITLSGAAVGCGTTTCYVPVPNDIVTVDQENSKGVVVLSRGASDTISGNIQQRTATEFSYAIADTLDPAIIDSGDLVPTDGAFDERTEQFQAAVSRELPAGEYRLYFYDSPAAIVGIGGSIISESRLRITQ